MRKINPLVWIMSLLILVYKFCISPLLPKTCIYYPTCSSFALQALQKYGPFTGSKITYRRLLRCNQKYNGGYDPVPENIKGDFKWLI